MRYQYTGDLPAVTPFQHGQEGVTLTRAVPRELSPWPEDVPEPEYREYVEAGTIVIEPGDILELAEPIVHAHFALLDDAVPTPETAAQRKAREKREAADAKPADAAPAAGPEDATSTPAHSPTAPIPSPQAAADGSEDHEAGNPAELGTVLDGIATQYIPDGMTDMFRSAGIIPE